MTEEPEKNGLMIIKAKSLVKLTRWREWQDDFGLYNKILFVLCAWCGHGFNLFFDVRLVLFFFFNLLELKYC